MNIIKNKRYTLNEFKEYLIESAEGKAKRYCETHGLNIDYIKDHYTRWRVDNGKYLLALCILHHKQPSEMDELNDKFNDILSMLGFDNKLSSNFDPLFNNISDFVEDDNGYNKIISGLKKRYDKIIKINNKPYICLVKIRSNFWRLYSLRKNEFIDINGAMRNDIALGLTSDENNDRQNDAIKQKHFELMNYSYDIDTPSKIVSRFEPLLKEYEEKLEKENNKLPEENNGRYTIVPIYSFNRKGNDKLVNGYPTWSTYYSKFFYSTEVDETTGEAYYEDDDEIAWCVTYRYDMFEGYTKKCNGGAMFYFCLRDDWKDIRPTNGVYNKETDEYESPNRSPLDDYGTSMFAVSVNVNNEIKTITSRWNHEYGGGDSVIGVNKLCKYLGFNATNVLKYNMVTSNNRPTIDGYDIIQDLEKYYIVSDNNGYDNGEYHDVENYDLDLNAEPEESYEDEYGDTMRMGIYSKESRTLVLDIDDYRALDNVLGDDIFYYCSEDMGEMYYHAGQNFSSDNIFQLILNSEDKDELLSEIEVDTLQYPFYEYYNDYNDEMISYIRKSNGELFGSYKDIENLNKGNFGGSVINTVYTNDDNFISFRDNMGRFYILNGKTFELISCDKSIKDIDGTKGEFIGVRKGWDKNLLMTKSGTFFEGYKELNVDGLILLYANSDNIYGKNDGKESKMIYNIYDLNNNRLLDDLDWYSYVSDGFVNGRINVITYWDGLKLSIDTEGREFDYNEANESIDYINNLNKRMKLL